MNPINVSHTRRQKFIYLHWWVSGYSDGTDICSDVAGTPVPVYATATE